MIRKIGKVILTACLVAGSIFAINNTANAEEFNPEIKGTLTNAGDVVSVKNVSNENGVWVKYVSSTDEFMYVYTDAEEGNPIINVYDDMGSRTKVCSDLQADSNGSYNYMDGNQNNKNAEIYLKLKKGKVLYFYMYSTSGNISYNVKLIKTPRIPEVDVYARGYGENGEYYDLDLSDSSVSISGLSYDNNNRILTMENYNGTDSIYAKVNGSCIAEGLLEVNVLGNNSIKSKYRRVFDFNCSVKFTGNGELNIENYDNDNRYDYVLYMNSNMLTIDGPTLNIFADGKTILYAYDLYMNSGNLIFPRKYTPEYHVLSTFHVFEMNGGKISFDCEVNHGFIDAGNYFIMTDGEISLAGVGDGFGIMTANFQIDGGKFTSNAKLKGDVIRTSKFLMNGGTIDATLYPYYGNFTEYNRVVYSYGSFIEMNGGAIFVKYIDPQEGTTKIEGKHTIEAAKNIELNDGAIYINISDYLKEELGKQLVEEGEEITDDVFVGLNNENPNAEKKFVISDKVTIISGTVIDISKCVIDLEYTKCLYDGEEKTPKVTIDGLTEGKDFTVVYSDNVNIGAAKVTVTGVGEIVGEKEVTFAIVETLEEEEITPGTIEELKPETNPDADSKSQDSTIGKTVKDKKYIYKIIKEGSKDGKNIGELEVIGLKKKSLKKIKIAAKVKINGITYKVTSIGANAFKGNKKITKVYIGKNIKTIGKNAFKGDNKLKKIIIKSTKITKIGKNALKKTYKKLVVKVPKSKKKAYKKMLKKAGNKKVKIK